MYTYIYANIYHIFTYWYYINEKRKRKKKTNTSNNKQTNKKLDIFYFRVVLILCSLIKLPYKKMIAAYRQ